ncbi:aspartate racemase [Pedobacter sp. AK013]|uniref:aspartate/glutamate racemase family protein n=1 Tax=Pedobacter sp. AK013 TaxID=2723071 RepID=UPI001610FC67|nr:amino acid racemase [Pedobacter sp. AK013]MBB6238576.1 aspartate racemase [Pedobacter sp. AK013]
MKKIGLVGGISWVSTLDYYKFINEGVNRHLGGLNFAECLIYSLNFGDVQDKTWEGSFELLLNACQSLKSSGVEAIVLCANTAHLFADEIESRIAVPIIHIGTETAKALNNAGLRKIGLLGTIFTMEKDFYIKKLQDSGLEVLIPRQQDTRNYIQYTLKEELGRGLILQNTKARYVEIVKELVAEGAEGIILGCTEIPMLISQDDFDMPIFDTTKIHCEAIVDYILS